jgi:hypothetical protein
VLAGSLLAKRSLLMQRFTPKTEVRIWRPAAAAHPLDGEQEQGAEAGGSNILSGVVEECGEWEARVRLVHRRDTVLCVPLEHLALAEHVPQLLL